MTGLRLLYSGHHNITYDGMEEGQEKYNAASTEDLILVLYSLER